MFFQFDTGEQKQWKNRTPLVHRPAVLLPATHYHYKGCLLILLLVFRRELSTQPLLNVPPDSYTLVFTTTLRDYPNRKQHWNDSSDAMLSPSLVETRRGLTM
jgi:hypothetical protein